MSAPESSGVTGTTSEKSVPQITVQKAATVVQATAQQAAATAFRTITSGGQSSQVRVVVPPVAMMPQAMIKQIESGGVRTQITAISSAAAASRTMSQTSITVARPVTPNTYIPRAGVTTTNIQAQRLATPIRTPTPPTVAQLSATGSFIRTPTVAGATAVSTAIRNQSSVAGGTGSSTALSQATATWMAATGTGQVQLIRAINHQPRQRIIAQNISSAAGAANAVSVAQAANIGSGQTQQQNQTSIQAVQTSQQQQAFVASLATVMPPRQQTATLVYSNVSSTQGQQYNATSTPTQRFTVAAPLATSQRQVRPIQLGNRTFSTAKIGVGGLGNTTNISIRAPNIPVLAPTLNAAGNTTGNIQARVTSGGVNISTTSLSTTRIIQLQQQQHGSGTQQIIGSSSRLASNLMLQPIIMNTTGGGKIGIRPPTTIAAKTQPSLTITQLSGIGKISAVQQSSGTTALTATNIQSASITPSSTNQITSNVVVTAVSIPTSIVNQPQQQTITVNASSTSQPITQIVNINPSIDNSTGVTGQIIATQNVPSSATVVPLTITSRGTNVLTGTISSLKTGATTSSTLSMPPIAKVIPQQQQIQSQAPQQQQTHSSSSQSSQVQSPNQSSSSSAAGQQITEIITSNNHHHQQPTSVFIHTRPSTSSSPGKSTVISSGTFLPAGGTFYYESVPATSVSTGVISLTTTKISTVTNATVVAVTSNSNLPTGIVSSISYNSSAGGTFTVVPSSSRTIGQIQIPVTTTTTDNSGTVGSQPNVNQIQTVPIRFTPQHIVEQTINISQTPQTVQLQQQPQGSMSQQQTNVQQVIQQQQQQQQQQQSQAQQHHQILTMTQQSLSQQSNSQHSGTQQTHMIIPVQTSIKIPVSAVAAAASPPRTTTSSIPSINTSFFRKRDNDGSPIRAAKNLAPTLISMGTSNNNQLQIQSQKQQQHKQLSNNQPGLEIEINKDCFSERPTSPHSRPSSSGSTTVSANSSPGVDQQINEELLPINITRSDTHFNPINEMYANHQNAVTSMPLSSSSSSTSSTTKQMQKQSQTIESTPRKKPRRQTNDSQTSQQTHQSTTIIIQPQQQLQLQQLQPQQQQQKQEKQYQQQHSNNQQHHYHQNVTNQTMQVSPHSLVCPPPLISVATPSVAVPNHENTNNKPNNTAINNKENTKPTEYILKKPRTCSLLDTYRTNWKATQNHFQRYSDVKPREERRPTVMDLANQANIMQKINGWKIHHLSAQMDDLCDIEKQVYEKLESMLKQFENHEKGQDIDRVNELIKGNMQRSKIVADGVKEAQTQIMKIFDHKSHVSDIIHRCASKRNFKKREKT